MAWSATKTSNAPGHWNTGANWTPGGVPDQNDYVTIAHDIDVDTDALCAGLYVWSGILAGNAGQSLTIKDAAGTHTGGEHILVRAISTAGFDSAGTAASPFVIKSQNAVPTYPVKMLISTLSNPDTRVLDFTYCELRNFAPCIGNDTNYLFFNTGDVTNDGILDVPAPIRRDQKIDEMYCEGRSYDRIYPEGGHAGVLDLSGLLPWSGYYWQKLGDMRDARTRISFIGQYSTMPRGIIESLRFGSRDGPYVPFSLTLIEDL